MYELEAQIAAPAVTATAWSTGVPPDPMLPGPAALVLNVGILKFQRFALLINSDKSFRAPKLPFFNI